MSKANVILLENYGDELERKRLMKKQFLAREGQRKRKKKRVPPPNMVSEG